MITAMCLRLRAKFFVASVYDLLMFSDLRALRWAEGWMAFLFGAVLWFFPPMPGAPDQEFLNMVSPVHFWGLVFFLYGSAKLFIITVHKEWRRGRMCCNLFGLTIWTYTFVTAALIGTFSVTDVFFIIPITAEAWFLADNMGSIKNGFRTSTCR